MAVVTRYVNTDSTPGGDGTTNATSGVNRAYASRSEWEAAEQTDLVTDGDSHVVECNGSANDTAECNILGWTTGASNTITMKMVAGTEHDGTPGSGEAPMVITAAWTDGIELDEEHVTVEDQVVTSSASNGNCFSKDGSSYQNYTRCIAHKSGGSRSCYTNFGDFAVVKNCLAVVDITGTAFAYVRNSYGNTEYVNCVAVGPDDAASTVNGFDRGTGDNSDPKYINCVAFKFETGSGANFLSETVHANSQYNAASDGSTVTPPGSNPITTDIVATDFLDEANDDFHIAASGSTLEQAGIGTTQSEVPATDIDGDARGVSTTGLGIDEGPAAAADSPPHIKEHRHIVSDLPHKRGVFTLWDCI